MKQLSLPRSASLSFRKCWVVGLIWTQFLLAVVCAQPGSFVSQRGAPSGLRYAEFQGLARPSSSVTFSTRGASALTLSNWFFNSSHLSAERTVRQVLVDIDHDGDMDLIAVTDFPRLLVWLNNGRGSFTPWHSSCSLHSSSVLEDAVDSNGEDTPQLFLCLEARALSLQLIPLASTQSDPQFGFFAFDSLSLSSPRAPPSRTS